MHLTIDASSEKRLILITSSEINLIQFKLTQNQAVTLANHLACILWRLADIYER